jgi:hypothetical protein
MNCPDCGSLVYKNVDYRKGSCCYSMFATPSGPDMEDVKEAFSLYVKSEGCSCCQDFEAHDAAKNELGKLLGFKRFDDDSGYDFYPTKEKVNAKEN